MTSPASRIQVSFRLYVLFSLLMALSAAASGLFLLYLARPLVKELSSQLARQATVRLFTGAATAGAVTAVVGLLVGLRFASRIRRIIEKTERIPLPVEGTSGKKVLDEVGALDAIVGRLTLSMDRFVRDSDILARLPEGMLLLGPNRKLLSFNASAETLLELPLEAFRRGQPILSPEGLFPLAKGNEPLARLLDQPADRSVFTGEIAATTATGRPLLLEVTLQRREGIRDSPVLVLLFRDASEKRRIREEIRRADQLAVLGGMAARVAHEVRTPLATIRGLVELLQADLPESDSRQAYIDRILRGVERQDRLVDDLLTLSHPDPETWQPVSLPAVLKEVFSLLPSDPRLPEPITGPPGVSPVSGDPFRLSRVFTNLIQNAFEATPESGAVDVWLEADRGERVRVVVRNSGVGIPPELHERIFQPFFTTKPRGTGLGLAIARQIVEAHRGSLRIESDGHSETRFIVELPVARSEAGS